jgi:EAL domain-containing protein (putative c-di-GMP-specific phosphodiesterase class I)
MVAEGVETAAQLSFLRTQCCDAVQGYFLHRPLPDQAVAELLDLNRRDLATRAAMLA